MCEKVKIISYILLGDRLKKTFEIIGLISLICFSFFYTEQISTVIKENDDILNEIELIANQYKVEPIDALIKDNDIIPGLNGVEIDIKKSYRKMKKINSFNSNLLVYKEVLPEISINEKYDKYIVSGNKLKKQVSLLFLVEENSEIEKIITILKKYGISAVFYTDGNWFENNNEKIIDLIKKGHLIGNLGYNYNYNTTGISWMNTVVTKIGKQNNTYCFTKENNQEVLDICKNNKSYTIKPNIIVENNPLIEIKNNLTNGGIIALKINKQTIEELPLIIEYINSKDLEMVNLETLLDEKR